MANDITQLMSPTLLFMLWCYFVTLGIRRVCELKWPALTTTDAWTDILPVFPVVVGIACAYVPKYPIPAAFIGSVWSKGMWGAVAGALSTWAYDILQSVFKRLFGFDIGTMQKSLPPRKMASPPEMPRIPPPPPTGVNFEAQDISTPATAADPEKKR
jgi:hypothetical protein